MNKFDHVFDYCKDSCMDGSGNGVFPSVAIAIGNKKGVTDRACFGRRSIIPEEKPAELDTLYDIASLTKVVATTTLFARLLERGKISPYDGLSHFFDVPEDKKHILVHHLMTHTAGLTWHIDFWKICGSAAEATGYILKEPLAYETGTRVVYSDLGFMLLGRLLEKAGDDSLDSLVKKYVFDPLDMESSSYNPLGTNIASTERVEDDLCLCGEVHDENARFFGGVSGHAGVFSNLADLSRFALMMINNGAHNGAKFLSPNTIGAITRNQTGHLNENRSLGWCVKGFALSSGGDIIAPDAYGHTGFTGTSVWISPSDDRFAVILTNRVHPTRANTGIIRFRRLVHNMIFAS